MTAMPENKDQLIARIRGEWSALLQAIDGLGEAQMTRPDAGGWSIKDNLAHISEWERFLLRNQFQGQPPHQALQADPAQVEPFDETRTNALLFARNRERSIPDVLADLHRTHAGLMAALERAADQDLQAQTRSVGSEIRPVMVWTVYNTYEHYAEHRATILRITAR